MYYCITILLCVYVILLYYCTLLLLYYIMIFCIIILLYYIESFRGYPERGLVSQRHSHLLSKGVVRDLTQFPRKATSSIPCPGFLLCVSRRRSCVPEIQIDILAKVLKVLKWLQRNRLGLREQFLGQNFEAVLAVVVTLAGEAIFAKFCQDILKHILRHPFANFR